MLKVMVTGAGNSRPGLEKVVLMYMYRFARVWMTSIILFLTGCNIGEVTPPIIISSIQVSNITATSATISFTTSEQATTRIDYADNDYYTAHSSYNQAEVTGDYVTSRSVTLSGLSPATSYHYRISVTDQDSNTSTASDHTFTTQDQGSDAPVISNPVPSLFSTLAAGTTSTTLSVATDEAAVCKYSTTANTPYDAIPNTFAGAAATQHETTLTGLAGGNTYAYYIRCQDTSGNANSSDYVISFSVASSGGGNSTNNPPLLSTIADIGVTEGETVRFSPTASDTDGDSLSFSYSGWMTSSSYTTQTGDAGVHTVTVTVEDGNGGSDSQEVVVEVLSATADSEAPVRSAGSPTESLPLGTTSTTLSLTTDEDATCRYETMADTPYASMTNTFSTTGATSHDTPLSGLSDDNLYTYYVRCLDTSDNTNTSDYPISFSVGGANHAPVASPLTFSTYASTSYSGQLSATDEDGDALTYGVVNQPQHGAVTLVSATDGTFIYNPNDGYEGADSFTFSATDTGGESSAASVTITVVAELSSVPVPMDEFFVNLPISGLIPVTLHPGSTVVAGETTKVAFGMPFPRTVVDNATQIVVTDINGQEIASHVVELNRWNSLSGDTSVDSLRSALIYIDVVFPAITPITVNVKYGVSRILELGAQPAPETTWVAISNGPFPDEYPAVDGVMEPAVYATLPADWLSATLMRGRTLPLNSDTNYQWFDDAFFNYAHTAVNDVSDYVTLENLVDYLGDTSTVANAGSEPWLFDRSTALFGLYVRTGDIKWLRHAHRSSQYYAKHITDAGYFDKKISWGDTPNDLKYSYGQALLLDMMVSGDTRLKNPIVNIAAAGTVWNETYTFQTSFWTERHHTYALLAALAAWEATGLSEHADRVHEIVDATFNHALNPPNGWTANGSLMHAYSAHEGALVYDPIASPWMSALLGEAIVRYYILSEDENALTFLANFGDYLVNVATYRNDAQENPSLNTMLFPYYLASEVLQEKFNGGWGDLEHTCDVLGLAAKGVWAKGMLGKDSSSLSRVVDGLLESCQYDLDYWHREDADINYGKTVWRLSPSRKFSWWFGSTLDLPWMYH